jgi:hypothetical protein
MLNEIWLFIKYIARAKTEAVLFCVLAVLAAATINNNIVSNFTKLHQAYAQINDLGSSLGNIIKQKVRNAINESFNQALSGTNNQSAASTTNQQTTMQSSISGTNKSTNLNCTNGRCITTTCTHDTCTTTIQNPSSATGTISPAPASNNITTITIGEPFYKQNDKPTNQKTMVVNGVNASEVSFSGSGTTNGINFRDTGKALIMPRAGGATYIQGNAEIVNINNSSEKATYSFQEIGRSASDGTIKANGAAFFGSNAKGKLAFLNNIVVIYQDQIDKSGNSKLIAWKWK